jgi:hypothetical protein
LFEGQILPWLWELNQSDPTIAYEEDALVTSMQGVSINERDAHTSTSVDSEKEFWDEARQDDVNLDDFREHQYAQT